MRTSILKSNKGSALLLTVMGIAALSAVIASMVFSRAGGLAKTGKVYRAQLNNTQVKHELEVIFANPTLCKSKVTATGSTFSVPGVFTVSSQSAGGGVTPLSTNSSMGIRQMLIENVVPLSGGLRQADFSIVTQVSTDNGTLKTHKNTVSAIYATDASGNFTDCRIVITAQKACQDLGFTWIPSSARCGICERMGGTWASNACSLVSSGG